jgi:fibro-slime domain-containing protein
MIDAMMHLKWCAALCAAGSIAFASSPALAGGSLTGAYFILPGTHPDVGHGADDKIVTGLVQKRLGPSGLPIVTAFGRGFKGDSGPIKDVDAAGQLMWYSTAGKNGVRREKIVEQRLPFSFDAFYPDGKSADGGSNGYLAVHWSGTFTLPKTESIGFSEGSDDDSWVFVDGRLVVDNGGVKPLADAPFTVARLAAGPHTFDVFYADRHTSGAQFHLSTAFALSPRSAAAARPPAAPPVPSAATLATAIKKTGHVAVYGIHFAFDKADITKDSSAVLAQVAKVLRGDPSLRLRIEGHTDATGDAAYNRDLSQRRADAVKAYLVRTFSIDPSRLTTQGFGPDRPVATNATSDGRFKNRRVELVRL